ncbi:TIGR04013 family B12-binding domain/radical SAM domain-containing protein [Thermodesulfobacterium hydrogeniphilum]|uniref:TIGR04013 family B12-binding domain/radical SAM domain-containing protein n=1 Tax=Thermodesulfobacterium hydrogeniphilum TaxID=161156 RepID=UPI000570C536|nr:TIGR04013 family B12-binding domain/radical SAM domain-containing protein [Thermodesulfobacterium hydrogeniphilum]
MLKNIALVIYLSRLNRYSFNAILGALETQKYLLKEIEIFLCENRREVFKVLSQIKNFYSQIILALSFFTPQLWEFFDLIKKVKKEFDKKVFIIAGGPHPTGDPERTLKAGADLVVLREGEETFLEFCRALLEKRDFFYIKGIAFLKDNRIIFTGKRKNINLDKFLPFSLKFKRFGPIEITRGCPFACYFCQTSRIFGTKVRHRSIEKICEIVEILKSRNLTDIRFITPNAFSYGSSDGKILNLEALESLLKNIRKIIGTNGRIFFGSFPSEVRPEHVTKETLELVLRYCNNDNLVIGAQSGSQKILDLCHRGHTVEDVYTAVKLTIKAGLKAKVDFIFGLPGETEEDVKKTIKVIKDLTQMGAIIHAHTFMPLPQTPFAYEKPGKIDKELFRVINKLLGKGLLFGDWQKQEKLSEKISEYLCSGFY